MIKEYEYIIKHLSIFAPNTPGTLAEIEKIFQEAGVNIRRQIISVWCGVL